MSLLSLASGRIIRKEDRTASNGNQFVKVLMRVMAGNESVLVTVFAWGGTERAALERLGEKDMIAVQGPLRGEIYQKDGQPRIGISITAESIVALRPPPKERKERAKKDAPAKQPRSEKPAADRAAFVDRFDDSVPF